jgi:hypothetical protein
MSRIRWKSLFGRRLFGGLEMSDDISFESDSSGDSASTQDTIMNGIHVRTTVNGRRVKVIINGKMVFDGEAD